MDLPLRRLLTGLAAVAALVLAAGAPGLAAHGRPVAHGQQASPRTILTVTRSDGFEIFQPLPPLRKTLQSPAAVQTIYRDILGMPPFPPGAFHCPADFAVSYSLVFSRGSHVLLQATADAAGCNAVTLADGRQLWSGPAFWQALGNDLGLAGAALRGVPGQGPRVAARIWYERSACPRGWSRAACQGQRLPFPLPGDGSAYRATDYYIARRFSVLAATALAPPPGSVFAQAAAGQGFLLAPSGDRLHMERVYLLPRAAGAPFLTAVQGGSGKVFFRTSAGWSGDIELGHVHYRIRRPAGA